MSQFVNCAGTFINLAYVKVLEASESDVKVVVANTHQTSQAASLNMDMIWKCPQDQFKIVKLEGGAMAISQPLPLASPELIKIYPIGHLPMSLKPRL